MAKVEIEPILYPRGRRKIEEMLKPTTIDLATLEKLLRELLQVEDTRLEIDHHNKTIPEDYDASDGIQYDLDNGYAATITLLVPKGQIFLFTSFFTFDILGTTYQTYIDGRLYVDVPDMEFPAPLGIPVENEAKIVVANASGATQTYRTYLTGIFRPRALWKRPVKRAW